MENFLLPTKVEFSQGEQPNTGSVVITPCFHGYGTTLGNALRRVLLSSLPGAAVEYFKIKGAQHEFSTVEGIKEDVVEMILNLKQLAVKSFSDDIVTLNVTKKGPGPLTAGDIAPNSQVEIMNKDLVIANLTSNKTVEMEIFIGRGRGFKPVEEKNRQNYDLGTIVVDSIYTPIKDVGYKVEYTRVGDITDYEKLTINIETNGTISPREAVRQSTQILMDHFTIVLQEAENNNSEEANVFSAPAAEVEAKEEVVEEPTAEEPKKKKAVVKKEVKAKSPKKK